MPFCPHCGSEVAEGVGFCSKCGKPQGVVPSAPYQPPAQIIQVQPSRTSGKPKYDSLICCLLCCCLTPIVAIIYYVLTEH